MTTKLIAKVNWTNHFYDEDYCWSFAWMYILVFDYSYLHPNCVNILTAFQQSHVTEEFFLLFPEYHRVLIKTFKTNSWLLSSVSRTVVTIGHNQKQTCVECHKLTINDKNFSLASIIKCFITLAIIILYWKWIIGFNWLCCQFHYISIQNEKLMEINFHYKMTRLISMLNIVGMCN